MQTTLIYLFDPLCGWCYGASPAIRQLSQQSGVTMQLAPTGLFAGKNGRTMDASFAQYAWSNDMRIEKLTGQRFTEQYREVVLGRPGSRFDSEPATLALTAVFLTEPQRELEALANLQEARYVDGQDITDMHVVKSRLIGMGLVAAAERLSMADAELAEAYAVRLQRAQDLLLAHKISGVPNIVQTDHRGSRLLRNDVLFSKMENDRS